MKLIVQHIVIDWSKESRGGPGAISRNSLPDALRLDKSVLGCKDGDFFVHEAHFKEWKRFEPRARNCSGTWSAPLEIGCVTVAPEADSVQILYCHEPELAGAPVRNHSGHQKVLFKAAPEELIRVSWNGRSTDSDGFWFYNKTILNISLAGEPSPSVFTRRQPDRKYEDFALLF